MKEVSDLLSANLMQLLMQMSARQDRQEAFHDVLLRKLQGIASRVADVRSAMTLSTAATHKELQSMSDTIASEIAALQTAVAASTTVEASAVTLIEGFAAQLAAAIAAATAAGATPQQLADLNTLETSITASSTTLAAAVSAGAPPAPVTARQ